MRIHVCACIRTKVCIHNHVCPTHIHTLVACMRMVLAHHIYMHTYMYTQMHLLYTHAHRLAILKCAPDMRCQGVVAVESWWFSAVDINTKNFRNFLSFVCVCVVLFVLLSTYSTCWGKAHNAIALCLFHLCVLCVHVTAMFAVHVLYLQQPNTCTQVVQILWQIVIRLLK